MRRRDDRARGRLLDVSRLRALRLRGRAPILTLFRCGVCEKVFVSREERSDHIAREHQESLGAFAGP